MVQYHSILNMFKSDKPLKLKPNLYFSYLDMLQSWAIEKGYYLIAHGSMSRDLDIVAIPITDDPMEEFELIKEIDKMLTGTYHPDPVKGYNKTRVPGGRTAYRIELGTNITRSGVLTNFYVDIKVVPLVLDV